MIKSFKTKGARDIFHGQPSQEARKVCPQFLWSIAARKLDMLDSAVGLNDLRIPIGNKLEKLKGDRSGQHSIRINEQYRICFIWGAEPEEVEIVNYHE